MRKIVIAVLVVALAFTCSTAFAGNNIESGTKEFSLFLGMNERESSLTGSTSSNNSLSKNADLRMGVFLIGGLQLGISLAVDSTESWTETNGKKNTASESESYTSIVFGDLKYNFVFSKSQPVVPYIGVGVGSAYTSSTSGSTTTTGEGTSTKGVVGIKFFVAENTSLNAEFRKESFSYKPDGSTLEVTQDTSGINFGLSVYF